MYNTYHSYQILPLLNILPILRLIFEIFGYLQCNKNPITPNLWMSFPNNWGKNREIMIRGKWHILDTVRNRNPLFIAEAVLAHPSPPRRTRPMDNKVSQLHRQF